MQANYSVLEKEADGMNMDIQAQKNASGAQIKALDTRFGKVSIDLSKITTFPKGLVGMPDKKDFCFTDFPSEKLRQFTMMQSATDDELAFITLPIDFNNDFIDAEDITMACEMLGIAPANLVLFLIVTVHRSTGVVRLSTNCVAPIFVDSVKRIATQFVFSNAKYRVRQML